MSYLKDVLSNLFNREWVSNEIYGSFSWAFCSRVRIFEVIVADGLVELDLVSLRRLGKPPMLKLFTDYAFQHSVCFCLSSSEYFFVRNE